MGRNGEYPAIALYVGQSGRSGFFRLHQGDLTDPEDVLPLVMSLHQIHLVFTLHSRLSQDQVKRLTAAGYLTPGKGRVSFFESIRQGSLSGTLDEDDYHLLLKAMPQVLHVLKRAFTLEVDLEPSECILVREEVSEGVWKDTFHQLTEKDFQTETSFQIKTQTSSWDSIPRTHSIWEILYAAGPGMIKRKDAGVDLSQVLLICDSESGFILHLEIFQNAPLPSQAAQEIHDCLEMVCRKVNSLPAEIRVKDPVLKAVLTPFIKQGGLPCQEQATLPSAEFAYEDLMAHVAPKKAKAKKKRPRKS
jgi:hypothetical protein